MTESSSFISLIHNTSLLLAVALVFDMISFRGVYGKSSIRQIIPGIILSCIGISVMLSPWTLGPGLVFDTRSVLTSMSGLFFGFLPTAIVIVSTSLLRFIQGGDGAITGMLVILATGLTGISWRHLRKKPLENISFSELYLFGFIVHLIMLLIMLTLPKKLAFTVLPAIVVPVLLIYPVGTALLGTLLVNRIKREKRNHEREADREELKKKSILLNETQKLTRVGGWEWNTITQEMYWTDEVYRIHGISPERKPDGKNGLIKLSVSCYEISSRPAIENAFKKCVEEGIPYDMEFAFTDMAGIKKWIRTIANPVIKDGKITGVIGNIMDITDKQESALLLEKNLREKELLMRELQHRVKNNLNIVSGIIRLGEMDINDEHSKKIFTEARNRINAISSIYEKLYQSHDISSIELHLYIDRLADSLISTCSPGTGRITLVKELDRCSIDLKRGVPVGLLINELITNSLKYAFPEGGHGTITVRLKNEDGVMVVSVEDDGAGLPPDITAETGGRMGFTLARMLAEQIDGELKIERTKGTCISVTFSTKR